MLLNTKWIARLEPMIYSSTPVDETLSFTKGKQWLVMQLTKANRPFKIYSLGAGVSRITTETDTCPCCKRKL
jgi:hypothetical protein